MYPEQTEQSQVSLPMISDETGQRVIEELGMDAPREVLPYEKREAMAVDIFSNLAEINSEFVKTTQQAIKDHLYAGTAYNRSACAEGMAVVLRAFDIQSDYKLINNFSNLQAEDLPRVSAVIEETLGNPDSERDLLERVLRIPKIPEQQIMLNKVVTKATQASGLGAEQVRVGAAAMYKILAEMRPKLYQSNPSTPPMSMPPQPGM
jgi:hypothetical protein